MNLLKHLNMIWKHKKEVRRLCFKCGLYYQGLVHDLSKYSIVELKEGIKYFDGNKSPNSVCRDKTGISLAWLHHKGRNKHHPEYWIDNGKCLVMPYKYAVESICDRVSASKMYNYEHYDNSYPLNYWNKHKSKNYVINEKMSKFYDKVLLDLKNKGEDYVFSKNYMMKTYQDIMN